MYHSCVKITSFSARFLGQVSAALHFAHEEGIIHRDVKPGNIMLGSDGRAFVADFGIAKAVDSSTMTAMMPGTAPYMSPEQCRSQPLNRRTDVYSLGIVAYEMLSGRRPFRGETRGAHGTSKRERTRWEQLYSPPPSLRGVNPETLPHVEQAVRRALSKNPTDRPQTVMDFYREFAGDEVGAPVVSATPPARSTRCTSASCRGAGWAVSQRGTLPGLAGAVQRRG